MSAPAPHKSQEHAPAPAQNELVQASQEFDSAMEEHGPEVQMQAETATEVLQMAPLAEAPVNLSLGEPANPVTPAVATPELQLEEEEEDALEAPRIQKRSFSGGAEAPNDDEENVQPKLTIGQPGDKYEREADAVASHVVQGIQAPEVQSKKEEDLVQEKVGGGLQTMLQAQFPDIPEVEKDPPKMEVTAAEMLEEGAEDLPNAEAETEGEAEVATDVPPPVPVEEIEAPEITAKSDSNVSGKSPGTSVVHGLNQSKGSGSNLQGGVKDQMESGFGTDFSDVKVHTDSNAVQMNQELGSRAFTNQNNIYFNKGQFSPDSTEGKTLLAHELTHTIQQGAVSNTVQASGWGDKPMVSTEPKATVPNDGDKVESRSDRKIKNDPDFDDDAPTSMSEMDEEDREKSKPDRSEVRKENNEVAASGISEVDEDRGKTASDKSKDQKAQIEQNVDESAETDDSEVSVKEGEEAELSEADAATQRATASLEQANAVLIPKKPEAFNHPKIEAPVDKEGKPLPRKGNIDTQVRGLGYMGELFREHGYEIKKAATNTIIYAHGLDSNLETQRADLANAKEGTATMEQHNIARQEISENSKAALKDSKERQAFVAEKAPLIASKAQEGQSESGDLLNESESKSAKSKSKMSSDPDARAKAKKQSSGISDASEGAESMDTAIRQAGERAVQYQLEAEQAAAKNEETKGAIDEADTLIEQTSGRIVEMMGINESSQTKIDNVAEGPAQMRTDAEVSIQEGDDLISASYVMEKELNDIQAQYLSGMKVIETKKEAEERIKKEKEKSGPKPTPQEKELVGLAALPEKEQQKRVDEISKSKDGAKKKAGLMAALDKMITTAPDKGTDATEGPRKEFKSGLQDKIMGGPPPSDPRKPAIDKVDKARESRLSGVMDIGDENIGVLTEAEKSMLAQKLTGEAVADDIKNIDVLQMGAMMLQGMVDPRMVLTGPIDGFDKMATGVANIFNAEAWEKDPLGNLLKIAADISTGLAMIFSGILGIAGFIMGVMIALSIASWGFALPITVPQMAWMGTLMGYAGWGAIIAGSLSVYFNYLSYLKNLNDAATAESARELFGNVEEMKQNVTDGFTGAMSIVEGVGAVKMGPMMKQGNFVDTSAMGTIDTVKGISSGFKNTPAALKKLPGNLAKGARQLFAGGKQGLIDFKDKLKTYFARSEADVPGPVRTRDVDTPATTGTTDAGRPSATRIDAETPAQARTGEVDSPAAEAPTSTRTDAEAPAATRTETDAPTRTREVDSDSPTTNRTGDQDAPGTTRKNDTDTDATTSRKEGDVDAKSRKPDSDSPENHKIKTDADGDLGIVDGQKVKAEMDMPGGHKKKVLADGQCPYCSHCKSVSKDIEAELEPALKPDTVLDPNKKPSLAERHKRLREKEKTGEKLSRNEQKLFDALEGGYRDKVVAKQKDIIEVERKLDADPTNAEFILEHRKLEIEYYEMKLGFESQSGMNATVGKRGLRYRAARQDAITEGLSQADVDILIEHFYKSDRGSGNINYPWGKDSKLDIYDLLQEAKKAKLADDILQIRRALGLSELKNVHAKRLKNVYEDMKGFSATDADLLKRHFAENAGPKPNGKGVYPSDRTNIDETLKNLKAIKSGDASVVWNPNTRLWSTADNRVKNFWPSKKTELDAIKKANGEGKLVIATSEQKIARKSAAYSKIDEVKAKWDSRKIEFEHLDNRRAQNKGPLSEEQIDAVLSGRAIEKAEADKIKADYKRKEELLKTKESFKDIDDFEKYKADVKKAQPGVKDDVIESEYIKQVKQDLADYRVNHIEGNRRKEKGDAFEDSRNAGDPTLEKRTVKDKIPIKIGDEDLTVSPDLQVKGADPPHYFEMKSYGPELTDEIKDQIYRYAVLKKNKGANITWEFLEAPHADVISLLKECGIDYLVY